LKVSAVAAVIAACADPASAFMGSISGMPLHRAGHASILRAPPPCPRAGVSLQARASRYEKKDSVGDAIKEDEVEEEKAADAVPESQELAGAIPPKWWLGQDPKKRPNIPVAFEDVSMAAHRIRGAVRHTACEKNDELSEITGTHLYFKHEYKQFTGSFKERGARNAMMSLPEDQKKIGVIAASAGNHALGLAYHGKLLGIPVTVVMPTTAPLTKVNKCRKLGANVVLHGAHIGEAKDHALADSKFKGLQYINGYDDPAIVAGAGTIGLEILEQIPDVEAVIVPVGGAGLIAGIALAIKSVRPDVLVIGVEPERCASYTYALEKGQPEAVAVSPTLADGLAVPSVGPHAFEVARHFVDSVHLTSEAKVALAVLRLVEHEKAVVEGGGAAGLAALLPGGSLFNDPRLVGKKVVIPLCGGNIDITMLGRVIERGLAADRRLVKMWITVSDRPGGLAALTSLISSTSASIWDISHERAWLQTSVDMVKNGVTVELTGPEHEQQLVDVLTSAGYIVERDAADETQAPVSPPGFGGYREPVVPKVWNYSDGK